MKIQTKLFTGAVAMAVTASTVLAATNASAYPGDNDRYNQNANQMQQDRGKYNNRTQQENDRYSNNRNQFDRGRSDNYRTKGYPSRIQGTLPSDFRKVTYRNHTYYTRDNHYYSYDSASRSFVTVKLPFINIHL